jgi:hypothetical protein
VRAPRLEQRQAVAARQAQVEEHRVVRRGGHRGVGLTAVAHPIDGVALLAQALARGFADHRIVFYEEEAHVQ